jgi:hypothetical protein
MEMFGDIEQLGIYLVAVVVTLLVVLLPMSAYATQKWTRKTYLELRSMNDKLDQLLELSRGVEFEPEQEEVLVERRSGRRREPTLGQDYG